MRLSSKHIDWDEIDTVLLDMDGTLFDQDFEDFYWDEKIPEAYAKKHGITLKKAREEIFKQYKSKERTPDWGNVDLWAKEFDLDLWKIRRQTINMMKLHPHTLRFLEFLKKHGKKTYLVTGALPNDVEFKMSKIKIAKYFKEIYTEKHFDSSKKSTAFWKMLQKKIKYDKNKTMVVDDNEKVLAAAKKSGIRFVIFKIISNSNKPKKDPLDFYYVHHFDDII
jgi:5'-nucleotidase